MNTTTIRIHTRNLPVWASGTVWLAAFLSPTAYCLLLAIWNRSQMPGPPPGLIISLFCLTPVVALLVCGTVVWRTELRGSLRLGWLVMTVLAMALQVGVLLWVVVSAITSAIALPQ
jgi:hypothetical protein